MSLPCINSDCNGCGWVPKDQTYKAASVKNLQVQCINACDVVFTNAGLFPDGSAATPSIAFANAPDTGIYRDPVTGDVCITEAGTGVICWSSNPGGTFLVENPTLSAPADTAVAHTFTVSASNVGAGTGNLTVMSENVTQITSTASTGSIEMQIDVTDVAQLTTTTTALGPGAISSGTDSVAIGSISSATTENSIAVGPDAQATGTTGGNIAIGEVAQATGTNDCIAIGTDAGATASNAIAIGVDSNVDSSSGVAIGNTAVVNGPNGVALGNNAAAGIGTTAATQFGLPSAVTTTTDPTLAAGAITIPGASTRLLEVNINGVGVFYVPLYQV